MRPQVSRILTLLTLSLFRSAVAQEVTTASIREGFARSKLVPDVLPSFEPTGLLEVVFTEPGSSKTIRVTPGMNLTVAQTAAPPRLGLSGLPPSSSPPQNFVAILLDPDAPTPQDPSLAQFLHFIGGDLTLSGGDLLPAVSALANRSQASVEYVGPGPPAGSPPHRYAFLVFTQGASAGTPNTPFNATSAPFANSTTPRTGFSAVKFAQQVGLRGPVAGTFFFVGPEAGNSTSSSSSAGSSGNPTRTSASGAASTTRSNSSNSALRLGMDIVRPLAFTLLSIAAFSL